MGRKKSFFFWTVNRLKKTSDCIKIDPPGPGRNLKKSQKSLKNDSKQFEFFRDFSPKTRVFTIKTRKNMQNVETFFDFFFKFRPGPGDQF